MFKILNTYMNPNGTYTITEGTSKLYRVYKNPNARDLFMKAQKAETVEERKKLFEQMGEYQIVNENQKTHHRNRVIQFLKGLFTSD